MDNRKGPLDGCQERFKNSKYPASNGTNEVYRFYCPKADLHLDISMKVIEFACREADEIIEIGIRRACLANCSYRQEKTKKARFTVLK